MIIRRGQAPWSTDMHLDRKSGCTVLYFLLTQLNPTEEEMSEITGKKAK